MKLTPYQIELFKKLKDLAGAKHYITAAVAAQALGKSRSWVYKMMDAGQLNDLKEGKDETSKRPRLVEVASIDNYIRSSL